MNIKTLFIFFITILMTLSVSFALEASRNEAEAATLSLSCSSSTSSSVTLRYSYSNATSPAIYRGGTRVAGFPSGSNSGTYTNRGLSAGTSYTYTLRSGSATNSATCKTEGGSTTTVQPRTYTPVTRTAPTITYPTYNQPRVTTTYTPLYPSYTPTYQPVYVPGRVTTTTPAPTPTPVLVKSPEGTLSCLSVSENSVTLGYTLKDATNASVFRGTERVHAIGSGTRSGSFVEEGLAPDTTYEFYLRNGLFNYSDQLSRVICTTEKKVEEEKKEELYITKSVKSLERDGSLLNNITVAPGEKVSFSIRISAGEKDVTGVEVRDILPGKVISLGNLRLDGTSVSGNIEEGVNIGTIYAGESKTLTFDAQINSRDHFDVGSTTLVNTARVTSREVSKSDTATLYVIKGEVAGPPTEVPTGITGNGFVDYAMIPLSALSLIFIFFKAPILGAVRRVNDLRTEMISELI